MKPLFPLILVVALGCSSGDESATALNSEISSPPSIQESKATTQRIVLTERQRLELNISVFTTKEETASFQIAVPGEVIPSPHHFADISAPISGRVVSVTAHEGSAVRKGQVLAEVESLSFANLVAEYLEMQAELAFVQSEYDRLDQLVQRGISPARVLEKAKSEISRYETRLSASYARLRAVGVSEQTMSMWTPSSRERPLLPIVSPIDGIIDHHGIEMGSAVGENQLLMTIVDPNHVFVRGFASPEDAGLMQAGSSVSVRPNKASTQEIEASIKSINPSVDESNRSVILNIEIETENGWPRPGESVQVMVRAASQVAVLSIPLSAVQYDGSQAIVFVALDESTFEARPVTISRMLQNTVFVSEGLKSGEKVAIDQVFTLKALSRFELYGEE